MECKEDDLNLEERLKAHHKSKNNKRTISKEEQIFSYVDDYGNVYNVRDHVYVHMGKPSLPYGIAMINEFRMKKDGLAMSVRWYYRHMEIPPNVYSILLNERDSLLTESWFIYNEYEVHFSRSKTVEMAYCERTNRGKCEVVSYTHIKEIVNFKPSPDTFFYILTYNPQAKRLASTQGEIRIGSQYQAKLPRYRSKSKLNNHMCEKQNSERETLILNCNIPPVDLRTYIQAAKSIAAFTGMCDRGNVDDMHEVVVCDQTTIKALEILHKCNYNYARALEDLSQSNFSRGIDKTWSEDEQKKFHRGIKQYGKNFFQIRCECLPNKTVNEIVEYYYLWKKTPAGMNRPRRRHRQLPHRRSKAPYRNEINSVNTGDDTENNEYEHANSKKFTHSCTHCSTTESAAWLPLEECSTQVFCIRCATFFKKYGELPPMKDGNFLCDPVLLEINQTSVSAYNQELNVSNATSMVVEGVYTEGAGRNDFSLEDMSNSNATLSPAAVAAPEKCSSIENQINTQANVLECDNSQQSNASSENFSPSKTCDQPNDDNAAVASTSISKVEVKLEPGEDDLSQIQSPAGESVPVEQVVGEYKNSIMLKVIERYSNSCARTDIVFRVKPDSAFHETLTLRKKKATSANISTTMKEEKKTPKPIETTTKFPTPPEMYRIGQHPALLSPMLCSKMMMNPLPFLSGPLDTPALRQLSDIAAARSNTGALPYHQLMQQAQYGRFVSPFYDISSRSYSPSLATSAFDPAALFNGHINNERLRRSAGGAGSLPNSTHNHAHLHAHSHTHLHLNETPGAVLSPPFNPIEGAAGFPAYASPYAFNPPGLNNQMLMSARERELLIRTQEAYMRDSLSFAAMMARQEELARIQQSEEMHNWLVESERQRLQYLSQAHNIPTMPREEIIRR